MNISRPPDSPPLPDGGARSEGGSDSSRRRQILGQDTYLREDCERSERLQPAAGGKFFEGGTFKVKID